MKKINTKKIAQLLIMMVFIFSCKNEKNIENPVTNALKQDSFNIEVVTEDWKPFNYPENGEIKGTSTVIVKKVLKEVGLTYNIRVYPWARAYHMALNEKNVLIYTLMRIPQREKLFKWVRPLGPANKTWLWKRKGDKKIIVNNIDDAKKYMIGTNNDSMDHIWLKDNGFKDKENISVNSKVELFVKMLKFGRVDMMAFNTASIEEEVKKLNFSIEDFEKVIPLFTTQPFMAFSQLTSDEYVEKFKMVYDQLVKENKLEKFE